MPYIPKSDCECYMEALELLNEALAPIDGRITALEENNCCEVLSERLEGIDAELDDHEERILELENSGGGGGEDNIIESISVFGVQMDVDQNKNVDLWVPYLDVNRIGNDLDADWQTIKDALDLGQSVRLFQQIGDDVKYTMFTKWEHNSWNDYNVWFGTEKYHAEAGDFPLTYVEG